MDSAVIAASIDCETQETTYAPMAGDDLKRHQATVAQAAADRRVAEEKATAVAEARLLLREISDGKRTPHLTELAAAISVLVDAVLGPVSGAGDN